PGLRSRSVVLAGQVPDDVSHFSDQKSSCVFDLHNACRHCGSCTTDSAGFCKFASLLWNPSGDAAELWVHGGQAICTIKIVVD
ncbi:MAG: hypothetical protein ABGZ23_27025, partial [Fuerstiella sp.]